jgi:hypothetical protein
VISRLLSGGVGRLYAYAEGLGYTAKPGGYVSKCELCFDIRKFLISKDREAYPDLAPQSFYEQDF